MTMAKSLDAKAYRQVFERLFNMEKKTDFSKQMATAMLIRSAISYHYKTKGSGDNWGKDSTGKFVGNPSLSSEISTIMMGLRKKKVRGCSITFIF